MSTVTVHQAKTHLSRLIRQVEAGEEVLIRRGDQPVARLVGVQTERPSRFGGFEGKIKYSDDLSIPLEDIDALKETFD